MHVSTLESCPLPPSAWPPSRSRRKFQVSNLHYTSHSQNQTNKGIEDTSNDHTHVASTVTSMRMLKSPAKRAMRLSSTFPPSSSTLLLRRETMPGRSGPEAVMTNWRTAEQDWDLRREWENQAPTMMKSTPSSRTFGAVSAFVRAGMHLLLPRHKTPAV